MAGPNRGNPLGPAPRGRREGRAGSTRTRTRTRRPYVEPIISRTAALKCYLLRPSQLARVTDRETELQKREGACPEP